MERVYRTVLPMCGCFHWQNNRIALDKCLVMFPSEEPSHSVARSRATMPQCVKVMLGPLEDMISVCNGRKPSERMREFRTCLWDPLCQQAPETNPEPVLCRPKQKGLIQRQIKAWMWGVGWWWSVPRIHTLDASDRKSFLSPQIEFRENLMGKLA